MLSKATDKYHGLKLVDEDVFRSLLFHDIAGQEFIASRINMAQPEELLQKDEREFLASFLLVPTPVRSLVVGLHNIGLINFLRSATPAQILDVIEYDPELIKAADTYFGLRSNDQLTIRQDSRLDYLLGRPRNSYDVIYLDAGADGLSRHRGSGLPDYAREKSFIAEVRERLTEPGVLIVTLGGDRKKVESDIDSVLAVFPHVFVWERTESGMVVLAALKHRQLVNPLILRERARKLDQKMGTGLSFSTFIDLLLGGEYRVLEI